MTRESLVSSQAATSAEIHCSQAERSVGLTTVSRSRNLRDLRRVALVLLEQRSQSHQECGVLDPRHGDFRQQLHDLVGALRLEVPQGQPGVALVGRLRVFLGKFRQVLGHVRVGRHAAFQHAQQLAAELHAGFGRQLARQVLFQQRDDLRTAVAPRGRVDVDQAALQARPVQAPASSPFVVPPGYRVLTVGGWGVVSGAFRLKPGLQPRSSRCCSASRNAPAVSKS